MISPAGGPQQKPSGKPDQRWVPAYLGQPVYNLVNACLFEYGIAAYDLEFGKYLQGRKDKEVFRKDGIKVLRKIRRQMTKDCPRSKERPAASGTCAR